MAPSPKEVPEAKSSGEILDFLADMPAKSWQQQAARYLTTTLADTGPDAITRQITETSAGLEVRSPEPLGTASHDSGSASTRAAGDLRRGGVHLHLPPADSVH